jgi:hypothetical protein
MTAAVGDIPLLNVIDAAGKSRFFTSFRMTVQEICSFGTAEGVP